MIFINQNLKTSGSSSSSNSNSNSSSTSQSSNSTSSSSSNSSSSSTGGTYTVKAGDTLSSIARANGMNYRTLMSINNISSHIIHPGQKLSLSGNASSSSNESSSSASDKSESKTETTNNTSSTSNSSSSTSTGTYSVKAGDTLSSIARANGTTYRNIMDLNNLSSTIIYPGQSLKVSGTASTSTNTSTSSSNASASSNNSSSSDASSSSSNASESNETAAQNVSAPAPTNVSYGKNYYTWGECTWYAFERRQQLGKPVGNGWGNAYNWNTGAKSAGYKVNNSPSVGAIMQADAWTNFAWGMGHVAIVERINSDGSILVSEMNFGSGQGVKAFRTISASQVSGHNFIH